MELGIKTGKLDVSIRVKLSVLISKLRVIVVISKRIELSRLIGLEILCTEGTYHERDTHGNFDHLLN